MLQTIKVERPFQKIGVDLLGPFPTSVNGNKMLIVAVDYLTKWVELEALPTGKADVVTQFIVDIIVLRHGAPESIITDRGKFFLAGITQNVWEKLGINHKTTSGYHPKTNGQVERMNHTLKMIISMYITDEQTNRDEKIQFICFAYNTAINGVFSVLPTIWQRTQSPCGHLVRLTTKSRVAVRRSFATVRQQINGRFENS
jgi:hypothetical protein